MTPCLRPGCSGTIDDGFCDSCGLAPPRTATGSGAGRSSIPAVGSPLGAAPVAVMTAYLPRLRRHDRRRVL